MTGVRARGGGLWSQSRAERRANNDRAISGPRAAGSGPLARRLLRCSNGDLPMTGSRPQDPAFTEDQKQYLEGFIAGIATKRGISLPNGAAAPSPPAASSASGMADAGHAPDPAAIHRAAQDRVLAAGGKLVPEELAKREKQPQLRRREASAIGRPEEQCAECARFRLKADANHGAQALFEQKLANLAERLFPLEGLPVRVARQIAKHDEPAQPGHEVDYVLIEVGLVDSGGEGFVQPRHGNRACVARLGGMHEERACRNAHDV